jgi:hypothetical protein
MALETCGKQVSELRLGLFCRFEQQPGEPGALAIDLDMAEGLEHCRALVAIADILIGNLRPGPLMVSASIRDMRPYVPADPHTGRGPRCPPSLALRSPLIEAAVANTLDFRF